MTDLRAQLKGIETASPPDLWAGIEARAMEEAPEMDTHITSFEAFRTRQQERRRRLAAGLVAAAVVAAVAVVAWRSFQVPTTIPAPPGADTLPAGWERCTNAALGFSIGYPGDWHTTDLFEGQADPANACRWFQPAAFGPQGNVVPEGWGFPLEVTIGGTIDQELLDLRSLEAQVLVEEPAVVDGHRATRVEYVTGSDPLADPGRHYQYVIALGDGTSLVVHTTETRGIADDEAEYERFRALVDRAVETIRFADA